MPKFIYPEFTSKESLYVAEQIAKSVNGKIFKKNLLDLEDGACVYFFTKLSVVETCIKVKERAKKFMKEINPDFYLEQDYNYADADIGTPRHKCEAQVFALRDAYREDALTGPQIFVSASNTGDLTVVSLTVYLSGGGSY